MAAVELLIIPTKHSLDPNLQTQVEKLNLCVGMSGTWNVEHLDPRIWFTVKLNIIWRESQSEPWSRTTSSNHFTISNTSEVLWRSHNYSRTQCVFRLLCFTQSADFPLSDPVDWSSRFVFGFLISSTVICCLLLFILQLFPHSSLLLLH